MKNETFLALNVAAANAVIATIEDRFTFETLTSKDFDLVKSLVSHLFVLNDDVVKSGQAAFEVWSAAEQDSFCASPWDQLVASAEEYALCSMSILLETGEFEIAVDDYDITYPIVAKFMRCAREAGVTVDHFKKHIIFLSRGNEDVQRMIENLL